MHLKLPIELIDIIIEKYLEDFEMTEEFEELEYNTLYKNIPVGYEINGEPLYEVYLSKNLRCSIYEEYYSEEDRCYISDNTCGKIRLAKFNSRRQNLKILYELSTEDKNDIYEHLNNKYNLDIDEVNNINKNLIERSKKYGACYELDCGCIDGKDYSCADYTEHDINIMIDRFKFIHKFQKELDKIDMLFKIVGE
jgi:hypothetical protein